MTALTAKGEKSYEYDDNTFELREVFTQSIRVFVFVIYTGMARCFYIACKEKSRAAWNPYETMLGWIPFYSKDYAALRSAPATMTTEVVPSPASTS